MIGQPRRKTEKRREVIMNRNTAHGKPGFHGAGILFYRKAPDSAGMEFFLAQRAIQPDLGTWSVPGGTLDSRDKDLFDTAIRETREEIFNTWSDQGLKQALMDGSLTKGPVQKVSFRVPFLYTWDTYTVRVNDSALFDRKLSLDTYEIMDAGWGKLDSLKPLHYMVRPTVFLAGLTGRLKL